MISTLRYFLMLILMVVQNTAHVESRITSHCQTLHHKECKFPFEFNNTIYTGCTDAHDPGKFWCQTKLSFGRNLDWDYCDANCPTNGGGTIGTKTCNEGDICMHKDRCPEFQEYLTKKPTRDTKKWRRKVCNRKEKRLCCKESQPPAVSAQPGSSKPQEQKRTDDIPDTCKNTQQTYPSTFLPDKNQCGQSCLGSKSVVHGDNAVLGEFPWTVLLGSELVFEVFNNRRKVWQKRTQKRYPCGGTLINTWFVLTAAHCQTSNEKIIEVVLGEWDVRSDPDCPTEHCNSPKVQRKEVDHIIVHPDYDNDAYLNDIALIKIKTEAKLNKFIQLVCLPLTQYKLPNKFHDPINQEATVTGWGQVTNEVPNFENHVRKTYGLSSQILQKGKVSVKPPSICEEFNMKIKTSQICANPGGTKNNTDSCKGDSGGGLLVDSGVYPGQTQGNMHVLIGVVSYGKLCGDSPSVYTKVEQFIPWIVRNIK